MAETVWVNSVVSNAPIRIYEWLLEQIRTGESLVSQGDVTGTRNHVAALRQMAEYMRSLYSPAGDANPDPLALLLMEDFLARGLGQNTRDPYVPTPSSSKVWHYAGRTSGAVSPRDLLIEVVSQELHDIATGHRQAEQHANRARQERDAALKAQREADASRRIQTDARALAEGELNRVKAQLAEARAQVKYLAAGADGLPVPAVETDPAEWPTPEQLEETLDKQRVKVAPGIYLERHQGSTWYNARFGQKWEWLGDATDGSMSIPQAVEARERLAESKQKAVA